MSLLRPLAPAMRASIRRTAPPAPARWLPLRFLSATAPASEATATASSAPAPSTGAAALPYRIGRSASLNLPVYQRTKSGGTNKTTEVKKVEGDVRALSQQLAESLGVETKINPRTRHIIIKGFHREKVVAWLTERGL